MRVGTVVVLIMLGSAALIAEPRFEDFDVLVANDDYRAQLLPGMLVSIYGSDLGPDRPCKGRQDVSQPVALNQEMPEYWRSRQLWSYPYELCGVRVTLDGHASELLYVQNEQINFRVPQTVALGETLALVVVSGNEESQPLNIEIGLEILVASFQQPAYTDMPIWLEVDSPLGSLRDVRYPVYLQPMDLGCNRLEVRQNGLRVEPTWSPSAEVRLFGGNCEGISMAANGRIPLHMLYRFDEPGVYEARLVRTADLQRQGEAIAVSNWVSLTVLPARSGMREQFLVDLSRRATSDAAALLSEFLPNLLGIPDDASFALLAPLIEHEHTYVKLFAAQGYRYWPNLELPQVGGVF